MLSVPSMPCRCRGCAHGAAVGDPPRQTRPRGDAGERERHEVAGRRAARATDPGDSPEHYPTTGNGANRAKTRRENRPHGEIPTPPGGRYPLLAARRRGYSRGSDLSAHGVAKGLADLERRRFRGRDRDVLAGARIPTPRHRLNARRLRVDPRRRRRRRPAQPVSRAWPRPPCIP